MATREITQFSTVDFNALGADVEDQAKYDKPKHKAMRSIRTLIADGKLAAIGGIENVRTVRVLQEEGKDEWKFDYVLKKSPAELAKAKEELAKAAWNDMLVSVLGDIGKGIAAAILTEAALILIKKLGTKATQDQVKAAAPEALKAAQANFKRHVEKMARLAGKKPSQAKQDGRQGARKHQGRGKPGFPGRKPQKAA